MDSITITSYSSNDEYVLVPSKINDIPVKRIALDTFLNNDYIIEFENGIKELSFLFIYNCPTSIEFEKIVVLNSVISINDSTFQYNNTIKEIVLPDCIQYIGYLSFDNASLLEKINIPEN